MIFDEILSPYSGKCLFKVYNAVQAGALRHVNLVVAVVVYQLLLEVPDQHWRNVTDATERTMCENDKGLIGTISLGCNITIDYLFTEFNLARDLFGKHYFTIDLNYQEKQKDNPGGDACLPKQ